MRIGIESSLVLLANNTGVGYYARNLTHALTGIMPDDQFILCYISFFTRTPVQLEPNPSNVKYRRISLIPGFIYHFLDHYIIAPPIDLLSLAKTDVFIFSNYFRWPLCMCRKSVVVIYDLGFIEAPQYLVPRYQRHLMRRVPPSARKASHIVAISEYTKRRLVANFGLDTAKITVVSPAVDQAKYHPASAQVIEDVKRAFGIDGKYILYLGTIEPRKNIAGILRAYLELSSDLQDEYQLVLAGGKGWLDEEINQLAQHVPARRLVRTGYVADGLEPALYSGAALFVYPSHYEGWGMQILEAMACGTPVIAANNSSLPEAGGSAAEYFKSLEPKAMAEQISELLSQPQQLDTMRERGLERVKAFTWTASARKMEAVLRRLEAAH